MTSLLTYFEIRKDILGLNDRNRTYCQWDRKLLRLADNKLLTKMILSDNDIPSPQVYGVIRSRKDLDSFDYESLPNSFVLKPSKGLKGAGINIYYNRAKDGQFILANRQKHSIEDIKSHIVNILDGQFSMGVNPRPSAAIFEERIKMHSMFRLYSYRGIPDIRVIVYKGIPVMAMLRLPTKDSGGKANISLGAIGVGVDMARGVTTSAIKNGRNIEYAGEPRMRLSGIKIPYWNKILRIAHKCQIASGIRFLGVDIIIDKEKGPMVVELNARPGLGIQAANEAGLKERLLRVKKLKNISEDRAVRLAKDLFGGEIEEEIETISGREIIGLEEEVMFTDKEGNKLKVNCKIDTGADSSSIDRELARLLGYEDVVDYVDKIITADIADKEKAERKAYEHLLYGHQDVVKVTRIKAASGYDYRVKIEIPAQLKEKQFIMRATIADRIGLKYPVLIGKRDLQSFLIDTTIVKLIK